MGVGCRFVGGAARVERGPIVSLHLQQSSPIPEETVRVAQAAFPRGNAYMRMRDALGPLFADQPFAALFPSRGQPAVSPALLALASVMQFAEGLSDRQAADAVRGRIDWKYALGLPLTDPGFDASVLSEFRGRLLADGAGQHLFAGMLDRLREHGLLAARGHQRTDSTHVLAAIRVLNRLECVGETLRRALDALAAAAPGWLRSWVPAAWFARYARRCEEFRLPPGRAERYALAEEMGADGFAVLRAVYGPDAPAEVRAHPAIQTLRQVWVQQFHAPDGPVRWRAAEDLPPATLLISSPHDTEARYGKKRETEWTGYKVHLTETCDEGLPELITNVETTPATTSDVAMTPVIHQHLAARDLLPGEHVLDAGYMAAEHLVSGRAQHGIDLIGPVPAETTWQAQARDGFATAAFAIDWAGRTATCPQGQASVRWLERADRHQHPVVHIRFARAACRECPVRARCTHAATGPRSLMLRGREHYDALQAARQRQETATFKGQYAIRAGIEGTISQAVRATDLRQARYRGLAKTHLQHLLSAAAINLLRASAWLAEIPRALTRQSAFALLAASAVATTT